MATNHFVFHFIGYKYALHLISVTIWCRITQPNEGLEKMFGSALEWLVQHESPSSYIFQKQVYGDHHGLNNRHRNIFLSILTNNFVLHSVFSLVAHVNSPIKIILARKKYLSRLRKFWRHILGNMANSLQNIDKQICLFWNDSEHGDTRKSRGQTMPQGKQSFNRSSIRQIRHKTFSSTEQRFTLLCKRLNRCLFHKKMEPRHDKTNKMTCTHNEDSDQPGHLPSLISILCALRIAKDPRNRNNQGPI